VDLYAPEVEGYVFDHWSIDGIISENREARVLADRPKSAVAYYLSVLPVISSPGRATSGSYYSVSWQPVPDALYYQLEEDPFPDFPSPRLVHNGTGTLASMTHTKAATYYYRVRAYTEDGWSVWSNTTSVDISKPSWIPIAVSVKWESLPIWIAGCLLAAGALLGAWNIRKGAKTGSVKKPPVINCELDSKSMTYRPMIKLTTIPWLKIAVALLAILAIAVSIHGVRQLLSGWSKVDVPVGGTETVSVKHFGAFEVEVEEVPPIGPYVTVSSQAHGRREVGMTAPACYDGVAKGRVLVFQWVDSDVEKVYLRYKVMTNQDFESFCRGEAG
jgi:hypothetical protein